MSKRNGNIGRDEEPVFREPKKRKTDGESHSTLLAHTSVPDPKDYTVGWICALATEYVAAGAFLDEEHGRPDELSPNDNNDYTLGKVGKHNVVVAVLPDGQYGTDAAAKVAGNMLNSFPNVRIGLMVGIGGGVPTKHDIRLGDIVVSTARDGMGGVFQYDFGKTIQNQSFRSTRFLNQPPTLLQTAVNGLKAQYERKGHLLDKAINRILEENPRLQQKYKRPDPSRDQLYQSRVIHPPDDEGSCAAVCGVDPSNLISRPERTENEDNPAIHYGLIASANQVMKDAWVRDTLAKEKDVLCFEMEAAGLMNDFPCLVIRGICDYSDSHKNKEWQGYAAMAAAAYAKDLLCRIPTSGVAAEKRISDVLSTGESVSGRMRIVSVTTLLVETSVNEVRDLTLNTNTAVEKLDIEHQEEKFERWLVPPDPSINWNKALQQRHAHSGLWFLQGEAFANWKKQPNSLLWLSGIPGCGKTILSSAIIKDLADSQHPGPLLYFYFNFDDTSKQTLENMVRSLISQLWYKREDTRMQLHSLFSSCDDGRQQPNCESLCQCLLNMIRLVDEVWIVLDALDECRTRRGTLSWMRDLLNSKQSNIHLVVTSRPEQDIEAEVHTWARDEDIIPIQGSFITDDIRGYVHTRIRDDKDLERWRSRPDIQDEIESTLMEKADGM